MASLNSVRNLRPVRGRHLLWFDQQRRTIVQSQIPQRRSSPRRGAYGSPPTLPTPACMRSPTSLGRVSQSDTRSFFRAARGPV